jgi:predicted PurR-regulated permease PerM
MDFAKVRNYLVIALLIVVTGLFFWLLQFFAYPIFWAAVIAALFHPVYQRINRIFSHESVSASLSIVCVMVIILVPLSIVGTLVLKESVILYSDLNNQGNVAGTLATINDTIKHHPLVARLNIDQTFITEKISELTNALLGNVFSTIKFITQNSLEFIGMFVLMLYTLFFFLRDGERLLQKIMRLSPLATRQELSLYRKFTLTASSTIRGMLVIGGIQGLLGGIALAIAGINSSVIWGILIVFTSIIPGVGTALVWIPAAIYLLLIGHIWQGIFVAVFCSLVVGTIDNILRPVLVGKAINIHPLIILLSTLGGIGVFGISGFLIGPIIASLFLAFWEMYEEYYRKELASPQSV